MIDDEARTKRRDETHLQWQMRIGQMDAGERDRHGPILTAEAEQHAEYDTGFVMHVETGTLAQTRRNRSKSGLQDMLDRGAITPEQFDAAGEIMAAICMIEADVAVRGASLEARVDNAGSAKGILVERLAVIRVQVAYTEWRKRLPVPKRLVIDMLTMPQPMSRTARRYRMDWPRARKWLIRALDNWLEVREKVWGTVDEREAMAAQYRAGGGVLA